MPTCGVFLIPPADNPLYQAGTAVLGYDIRRRNRFESVLAGLIDVQRLHSWLGTAPSYGLHMTIAAGWLEFDEADLPEIETRLEWLAGRTAPFVLTGGRFGDDLPFRPGTLAATHDSVDGALRGLERHVVTLISPLRSGTKYDTVRGRYPAPRLRTLDRHGDPNAREFFIPHWTFASGLPDDDAYVAFRDLVVEHTHPFVDEPSRTMHVDEVHLVELLGSGYYGIRASFAFRGLAGGQ